MKDGTRAAASVLATMALSACPGASGPATTTAVDSAGVRIVTNLPGSMESAETWSLSEEPIAEIGAEASADVPLFRVAAVAPLDGGRVAVGMNGPPQVVIFERDGTLAATLGREGEGPGEFAHVGSVVPLAADSLAVWDPDRRRMSVFTTDGRFEREVDLSAFAPVSARAASSPFVASGLSYLLPSVSGSLLLFGEATFSPGRGVGRAEIPSYRITTDGDKLARFGPFPGLESYRNDEFGAGLVIFGARPYAATLGNALVVGTAESPQFRRYGPAGALDRIVRWPDHDRTVGGAFLARWSELVDADRDLRNIKDRLPRAARFPAYDGLVAGDGGEIWVGEYPGPLGIWPIRPTLRVPMRRWLVFNADGVLTAILHTPEGFQPHSVREGRVWGVFTDELDVETIRAYEVVKR